MSKIFELKITLQDTTPPIWRRVEVQSDKTLADLHEIIQTAMGWENSHLYSFEDPAGEMYFGSEEEAEDLDGKLAEEIPLTDIFLETGDRLTYEYDFGDSWRHTVVLEEILDPLPGTQYPRCTKGKRACPPEDCGGIPGYEDLVEVMKKKKGAEYLELKDWLGGHFDTEAFDINAVNNALQA